MTRIDIALVERGLFPSRAKAREAIDLNYTKDMRYAEIAERLGMKPEGVRTLMKRVIGKLRECMERKLGWPAE